MRRIAKWVGIILTVLSVSSVGLPAVDMTAPYWQVQAVAGMELARAGGLEAFEKNLPLLWSESETGRRFFSVKLDKELLRKALKELMALTPKNRQDSRVLRTTLMLWAALGIQSQQGEGLLDGLAQEPVDLRRDAVDLALYYGHLQQAERILAELEGEEVRAEWTYRRAVIAWRCGQTMLAAALWREALSQGLPVTSAVSKELGKAGLVELAGEHRVTRHVKEYLNTVGYFSRREGTPAEALYPKALRLGNEGFEQQRYEEAIREWTTLATNPRYKEKVIFLLGQALARLNRVEEARDAFNGALQGQPSFFLPYLGMSHLLQRDGNKRPAQDWLKHGYYRTGSGFLYKGARNVKKRYFYPRKTSAGEVLLNLNGAIAWDADGFWLSHNQGKDWLWYPWLQGEVQVPLAEEYWVAATRGQSIAGEVILIPATGEVPQENSPLKMQQGEDGTMEISWDWSVPVTISGEYWAVGGPRRRLSVSGPQTTHRLSMEVEPGLTYRFRVLAMLGEQEVALEEGEFTTAPRQSSFVLTLATGTRHLRQPQVEVVTGQTTTGEEIYLRMKEEGQAQWSSWRRALPLMRWDLSPGDGGRRLKFQYKDRQGNLSPVMTERVVLDTTPPTLLSQGRKETGLGILLSLQTNEPTVAGLWVKENDQWRLVKKTRGYTASHQFMVAKHTAIHQIWLEDQAGNVLAVPGWDQDGAMGQGPVALRINDGATVVRSTLVRLQTVCPALSGLSLEKIRFSNDGRLWSPWQPCKDEYRWHLSPGEGVKRVFAQVQVAARIITLTAEVVLDQTPPAPEKVVFQRVGEQVVVTWATAEPAKSRFYLGSNGVFRVTEAGELRKQHRVVLGKLDSRRYTWRLETYDAAGNQALLDGGEFRGTAANLTPPFFTGELRQNAQSGGDIFQSELSFAADGALPAALRVRYPGRPWSDWLSFSHDLPWRLKNKVQQEEVEVQFCGNEGNISPVYRIGARQDLRPPQLYNIRFTQHPKGIALSWSADKPAMAWVMGVAISETGETVAVQQVYHGFGMNGRMELGKLAPGRYRFRIFPRDAMGNWTWTPWYLLEVRQDAVTGTRNLLQNPAE